MASKRWIWPSGLAELNSHHDQALRGLNQRHASSVTFVWQAAGLAVMLAMPNSVVALYVGSIIVGLSVGNIVSLPPLVIQHEFAPRSFGLLVGLNATVGTLIMAAGPGLFGRP